MKTFRIVLTLMAAYLVAFVAYSKGKSYGMAEANRQYTEQTELHVEPVCWGDIVMEDFVLDVVDETDFWELCDSTAFNCYDVNTSEWYLAVILEYARIYNTNPTFQLQ